MADKKLKQLSLEDIFKDIEASSNKIEDKIAILYTELETTTNAITTILKENMNRFNIQMNQIKKELASIKENVQK